MNNETHRREVQQAVEEAIRLTEEEIQERADASTQQRELNLYERIELARIHISFLSNLTSANDYEVRDKVIKKITQLLKVN